MSKRVKSVVKQMRRRTKKPIEKSNINPKELIPSGSTMLNLACSDSRFGAFIPGTVVNIVGDKSTGKTMLSHTMFGEIASRKQFEDYRFIHRDVERSVVWDVEGLFGVKMFERLEMDKDIRTIEDFKKDIKECCKEAITKDGRPFIYILDSYDLLTTDEEEKKKDEKETGYSQAKKTKELGSIFRSVVEPIKKSNSLLIVISQVRRNMDAGSFGKKFYRTGGSAMDHVISHEIWIYRGAKIKREVNKRKRIIGVTSLPKVEKNRLTGKVRDVEFNIFYDYGVDDISSMMIFLIKEGFWKKKKGKGYIAKGLNINGEKASLIEQIEEKNLERKLRKVTQEAWLSIEESMKLDRKKRFN